MIYIKHAWIAHIGTYPPRECGIATFTRDLTEAMDKKFSPSIKSKIIVMHDEEININYNNNNILFKINDKDISSYIQVADKINKIDEIKIICIQHEFGIFGGEYGENIIYFLEKIKKPVVITFHTVIPNPNDKLKMVVRKLAENASYLVVMTNSGISILRKEYGINAKIQVIPHGTPTVTYKSSKEEKIKKGFGDKIILTSFGLINSGKGYEYVLEALPDIVRKFPNVLYLIIGETHPVVRRKEGEKYRSFLEKKVEELGIQKNVEFYNRYLTLEEIIVFLLATDVYISSSLNPNQIVSGTLSYAMACGRVPISTPFIHAKDIITQERGILVEYKKPKSFAESIINVLSNSELKKTMEINCFAYTRGFIWPNVSMSYFNIFKKVNKEIKRLDLVLPEIKLDHIKKLTDEFGIIQFANYTEPDINSGYTLDDNARALLSCALYHDLFEDFLSLDLIKIYLNFIKFVLQDDNKIYNYVDYSKVINLDEWSEDAHGRAITALGYLVSLDTIPEELKKEANLLFNKAKKVIHQIKSPRAIAFIIIGLYFYNIASGTEEKDIKRLADNLLKLYEKSSSKDWKWFERYLTYSNSKLPESLFYSYQVTRDKNYLKVAKETLDFLISITLTNGIYEPIGQNGWFFKGFKHASFDQQPVNTATMVQTLLLTHDITKDIRYEKLAIKVFKWFLGFNILNQEVYDSTTGGCHDGVGEFSLNFNQGAESSISYLLARLAFAATKKRKLKISLP